MGGAAAIGFVATLKLAAHWFSPRIFATATGIALFCGIMGAITAGVPLRIQIGISAGKTRPAPPWGS